MFSGPTVTVKSHPNVKAPITLDPLSASLTADQLIYILVKFMHITRDFSEKCDILFHRCTKSRALWQKFFGKTITMDVCVSPDYKTATYTIFSNYLKKIGSYKVTFSKEQKSLVKLICKYKRQFDGWGDDPKCAQVLDTDMKALAKKRKEETKSNSKTRAT